MRVRTIVSVLLGSLIWATAQPALSALVTETMTFDGTDPDVTASYHSEGRMQVSGPANSLFFRTPHPDNFLTDLLSNRGPYPNGVTPFTFSLIGGGEFDVLSFDLYDSGLALFVPDNDPNNQTFISVAGGTLLPNGARRYNALSSLFQDMTSLVMMVGTSDQAVVNIDNIVISFDDTTQQIPEPGILGLAAAGLGLLAFTRRRRV